MLACASIVCAFNGVSSLYFLTAYQKHGNRDIVWSSEWPVRTLRASVFCTRCEGRHAGTLLPGQAQPAKRQGQLN